MHTIKVIESLKEPSFRLFIGNRLCDSSALGMLQLGCSLLLYRLTGSAALLGLLTLLHSIPYLVLSPISGVVADRLRRKHTVLLGTVASMAVTLGVAISLTCGYLSAGNPGSWWVIMVAYTLNGVIVSLIGPSRLSMILGLVGRDRLTNAVSLNQIAQNLAMVIGPALVGIIIDSFNFEVAFYVMSALYLFGLFFWSFIPSEIEVKTGHGGVLSDITSFIKYLRQERLLAIILVYVMCLIFCSMPYRSLLPVFTEDILKVDAARLGLLQSVSGVGAMVGAIALAALPNKKRGAVLLSSGILLGLSLTAFSFSGIWYLSLVLVAVVGIGQAGQTILPMTLLQNYTSDEYRGRVLGMYGMELGISSFGAFFAGILSTTLGIQWSVGGLAMILVAASILVLIFVPSLRKLD